MQLLQRLAVFTVTTSLLVNSSYGATLPTSTNGDAHFVGYYIGPTTTQHIAQPRPIALWTYSATWSRYRSYEGFCLFDDRKCPLATQCHDGTLRFYNGFSLACSAGSSCMTATIYETSPFGLPSANNIACRTAWSANTLYRRLPQSTTSSSTSPSRSPILTSSSTASVQSTPSPTPSPNKSWIAGAVIGPIAAIALIILALRMAPLYRKKPRLATPHHPGYKAQQPAEMEAQIPAEMEDKQLAEMEGQQPAEMEEEQRPRPTSELPNTSVDV